MAVNAARAKTLFPAASDLSDPVERTGYPPRDLPGRRRRAETGGTAATS